MKLTRLANPTPAVVDVVLVAVAVLAALSATNVSALYNIQTSRDLVRIGQLRYDVYATTKLQRPEMLSYVEQYSDHKSQVFIDPMDETGINLVAATTTEHDEQGQSSLFLGCIRLNVGNKDDESNENVAFFDIPPSEIDQSVIISGFCVRSEHRKTRLTLQLIKCLHQYVRRSHKNVRWAYLTSPKDMLSVYRKLGFVAMPNKQHALLGNVARLKLDIFTVPVKYSIGAEQIHEESTSSIRYSARIHDLPKVRTSQLVLKATRSADADATTSAAISSHTDADFFKARIENAFIESMKIFNGSKTMQLLASGSLTLDQYKSILREVYYYVREDPQIEAMATAYLRGKARDVVKPLLKHAISEVGHEQLALNDLMVLGEQVDQIPYMRPLPTTMGLIAFAFYQVNYRNPIGHLGYLYFLEFLPTFAGGSLLAALKNAGIPEEATSFLNDHVEADVGHNKLMVHFINDLVQTPEDCHAVIHAIQTTAQLYAVMLDGAIQTTDIEAHLPDGMEL